MEEKRKDLTVTKQKQLFNQIIGKLNQSDPSFYYSSTSEIAYQIELYINKGDDLSREELEVLNGLNRSKIQMILSLHND